MKRIFAASIFFKKNSIDAFLSEWMILKLFLMKKF